MPPLSSIQCGVMWVSTNVNNRGEVAMGPHCNGPDWIIEVLGERVCVYFNYHRCSHLLCSA